MKIPFLFSLIPTTYPNFVLGKKKRLLIETDNISLTAMFVNESRNLYMILFLLNNIQLNN